MKDDVLTFEQKLWRGAGVILEGLKPVVLYLFLPAVLMSLGMALFGGRSARAVIADSGNFYYALGIILTMVLLQRQSKKKGSSLGEDAALYSQGLSAKRALLLAAMGLGFAVFFSAALTVIPFSGALMESYHDSSETVRNGPDRVLAMVSTMFLAPVVEEVVFRGYMLGRFLKWFKVRHAIVLSAAIFALCHVSLLWMVYAFFMGVLLAWVAIREDNTVYSAVLHIGFNISVFPIWVINGNDRWKELLFGDSLRVSLLGLLSLFGALAALRHYRREEII